MTDPGKLVMTVTGPVDAAALGITLPHEHLLLDLRNQWAEPASPEDRQAGLQRVAPENMERLRRNPYLLRDNLLLDDLDVAAAELSYFRDAGGSAVVDCTPEGLGRRPEALRELSLRTGLLVVAGCGFYTADTHPPGFEAWPIEAIQERIVRDLTEGIDGTDIRAGLIGEIGTSLPIRPAEANCLRAAARASRATDAAIQVHTYPWGREGLAAATILLDEGADPGKIVICHTDVDPHYSYIRSLLDLGVWVEFDNFGKEFPTDAAGGFAGGPFATDEDRVRLLRRLLDEGHERRLLAANDVCLKCLLRAYGGSGYDHVLLTLRAGGFPETTMRRLFVENPARLLAV